MSSNSVGPVLQQGSRTREIIAAIQQINKDVSVIDRGGYVRVLVPNRCVLSRRIVEELSGERFELPKDLEIVMSSFKGKLHFSDAEAVWEAS